MIMPSMGTQFSSVKASHIFIQLCMNTNISNHHTIVTMQFPTKLQLNSVALVHKQITPTKQPLLVGEVSANFCR
jgi:hypothetical protein